MYIYIYIYIYICISICIHTQDTKGMLTLRKAMYISKMVSSHTWPSHVTHMDESCHTHRWGMSRHTQEASVLSMNFVYLAARRATHINKSYRTGKWVMWHIWKSYMTHINESGDRYECVMSHIWMHHVTHVHKSCRACECVTSHIWMHHVTHMNASRHRYQ